MNKTYKFHIHDNLMHWFKPFYHCLEDLPVKTEFVDHADGHESYIRFKLNFQQFKGPRTATESEIDLSKCFATVEEIKETKKVMRLILDDILVLEHAKTF